MKIKAVIITVLIMILFTIIVQNTEAVPFKLLFWELSLSMIVWLLLVLIIGFVLGYIIGTIKERRSF